MRLDDENLMELSSDRNLVVFILDSYDRGLFDLVLEKHPELREELAGFTYYHNTKGRYPATAIALPQLLTGHVSDSTDYSGVIYRQQCYDDAPFLEAAKCHGFEVDIYTDPSLGPLANDSLRLGCFGNANAVRRELWSKWNFGIYRSLMRVSWFKYLPHVLKRWQWDYMMRTGFSCANADGEEADVRTERLLRERLNGQNAITTVAQRKVKVYHLHSVHWPHFNPAQGLDSLELVIRYRQALERAGLADRTALIVLADHGVLNRSRPILLCSNGGRDFIEDNRPVSYRHSADIWSSGLTNDDVVVVAATAAEMVPSAPDRTLMRNNFFDDETTDYSGRRLELIRLHSSFDVVGDREDERMVWNGGEGYLAVPIAPALRGKPMEVSFVFESAEHAGVWAKSAILKLPGMPSPVCGHLTGKSWTISVPNESVDISGAFARISFLPWSGVGAPPPLVAIACRPVGL